MDSRNNLAFVRQLTMQRMCELTVTLAK